MSAASPRYRILRRLGQGGMAEVFEAELAGELGFVRKVAIKRMLGGAAADAEAARRFLDEARIASRLHHANIVSIMDFGLLDGLPFQVLELVDGIDAQELQSRAGGVLPLEIALIICGDVAHGLDHAHGATGADGLPLGIVHRDVKPPNVLVSWAGNVKLTDFGIAMAHERAARTEAGSVPGTFGFIAPEQRTRSQMDGRTDVFSLGLALHAMIAGYTPLRDISVEVALLSGTPIALDPAIPADVRLVIERAVAPSRLDRPTAAQLADQLGAALAPRLTSHPRSYLRDYLAPLRGGQRAPGMLDQLLGLEVVPSESAAKDGPRCYELRPTVIEPAARRGPGAAPPAPEPAAGDDAAGRSAATVVASPRASESRRTPPRRSGWLVLAALALGGGGLATWQLAARGSTGAAPPAGARAAVSSGAAAATGPVDAGSLARASIDAGPLASGPRDAAALAQAPAAPRDAASSRAHAAHRRHRAAHGKSGAAGATSPVATGYLQVTGEANIGARVLVDGRQVGYAPNKLAVALGHHRVEIVRRDGSHATAELDITEYATVAHPVRPTFP